MAKIKIFVDTGADLSEQVAKEKNIGILRFMSIFGEESYVTGTELDNKAFYEKLEEFGDIPKTAQTPYGDMYDALFEAAKENDTVIYFTISAKASGQYNTARMITEEIKEEYPDADIRVVDTNRFSVYISKAALLATELAEQGKDADEIIEACLEEMEHWVAYILVDSLKYLEKGGRINKTSAIVGSLLDIKPVLTVANGLIEPVEKLRGKKNMFKKLIRLATEHPQFDSEKPDIWVVHSSEEYAKETIEIMEEELGYGPSTVYELGPVVGTHIGPGVLAAFFKIK